MLAEIWEDFSILQMILAAAFRMDWRRYQCYILRHRTHLCCTLRWYDSSSECAIGNSAGFNPRSVVVHTVHNWCCSTRGIPEFQVHLYADDTQLYDFCSPSDAVVLASRVNNAIEAVSCWMSSNRLCLNLDLDKTKYLWFGAQQKLGQRDTVALSNILAALVSDTVARNLGLLLDQELSMVDHITRLSQVCFFHLRRIRVVLHSLTRHALLTFIHAFVCSRLDFCNSAMFGINSYLLDRLQSILNAAARLILQIPKFSFISSSIRDELHWLPFRSRIVFKHCLLVRSCISDSAPSYLAELCVPVSSVAGRQSLRSASQGTLMVPRVRTKRYGWQGFSVRTTRLELIAAKSSLSRWEAWSLQERT